MKTILFVDDDLNSLEVTRFLFEQAGYNCVAAIDYFQAVQIAHDQKIDAAVIDLRMPGVDGNQLIKELREKYSFPIIAFTALDSFEVHEQAISNGANYVITKPCAPQVLLDTVKELIES